MYDLFRWLVLVVLFHLSILHVVCASSLKRTTLAETRYVTSPSNCWGDFYEQSIDEQHYEVTTMEQCQAQCDQNSKCKSYILDYGTLTCSLFSAIGGDHLWESAECGCKREYCDSTYQLQAKKSTTMKKKITYSWRASDWTPCSRACGRGVRTRDVVCYSSLGHIVDSNLCPIQKKPKAELICEMAPCAYVSTSKNCYAPDWKHAINHDTVQKESVRSIKECHQKCDRHPLCRSVVYVSSRSALTCALFSSVGGPREWPFATCSCKHTECDYIGMMTQQHDTTLIGNSNHDGSLLLNYLPHDGITYDWVTTPWTECSHECGTHLRTRELSCMSSHGREVELSLCTMYEHKDGKWQPEEFPATTQICHNQPCEYVSSHGSQCYGPRLSDGVDRVNVSSERACQHECDMYDGCLSLMWLPHDQQSQCLLFETVGGQSMWPSNSRCACKSQHCVIQDMTNSTT